MAASIFERLAEEVKVALLAAAIPGIVARVYRAREDAIAIEEGDTINVATDSNNQKVFSGDVDDNELLVDAVLYVRGDVWETKADAYAVIVHQIVMTRNYAGAGLKIARVRLTDQSWSAQEGDQTPGKRTLKFAFRFLTLAADITAQP